MLNGRIDRSHACSDHNKADRRRKIIFCRNRNHQDPEQFHRYPRADQQPVSKPVGDQPGDQPAKHQTAEDQRAKGCDRFIAEPRLGPGKITGRPQKTGRLPGAVGEKRNQRQQDSRNFQGFPDPGTVTHVFFVFCFVPLPQRQRENNHDQNPCLNERSPSVALVPSGQFEGQRHDGRADDCTDTVKAVKEVHDRGRIVVCHIVIDRCVYRSCTETIRDREQEQHPVLTADRKAQKAEHRQEDRNDYDPFRMEPPDHPRAEQRGYDGHEGDRHGHIARKGRLHPKDYLHFGPSGSQQRIRKTEADKDQIDHCQQQ